MTVKHDHDNNCRRGGVDTFALVTLAFVAGGAVMALELLGSRVISPYFGSTLYVWTSLITVTLVSLAAGYWVGGFLADRAPATDRLYLLVVLAGVCIMVIPVIRNVVLEATARLGLRAGSLVASIVLFSPALFLLATVSPYAVRLQARDIDRIGSCAGRLYAISTVGSVVGTILTGFFLIPNFGVRGILYVLAAVLFSIIAVLCIIGKQYRRSVVVLCLVLVAVVCLLLENRLRERHRDVVFREQTPYGEVTVANSIDRRWLLVDGIPQTGIDRRSGLSILAYSYYMTAYLHLANPVAHNAVVIGLGGGVVPMALEKLGIRTDTVEIDPVIRQVAEEHFGFRPGNGTAHVGDGRYFLRTASEQYDFIILDAYVGESAQPHLLSLEMFALAKERLTANGIVALNCAGFTGTDATRLTRVICRTLRAVFRHVDLFPCYAPAGEGPPSNVIILASDNELVPKKESINLPTYAAGTPRTFKWGSPFPIELASTGVILTDDFNPSDIWDVEMRETSRKFALATVPRDVLLD